MEEEDSRRSGRFSSNSNKCVRLINKYWLERGYVAQARIELKSKVLEDKDGRNYSIWFEEIVSDTINGMPLVKLTK